MSNKLSKYVEALGWASPRPPLHDPKISGLWSIQEDVNSVKRRDREDLQQVTEAQVVSSPTKPFDSLYLWGWGIWMKLDLYNKKSI